MMRVTGREAVMLMELIECDGVEFCVVEAQLRRLVRVSWGLVSV